MAHLGSISWPPIPLKTERLILRESEIRDRATVIDLFSSPEVGTHIGGPQSRSDLERTVPALPGQRPGFFTVESDGSMIGVVTFDRRDAENPGTSSVELGYLFLPDAWGRGYASEACAAALEWFASVLPGEPVVLLTQTANRAALRVATKLGFTEMKRFKQHGAEQWFGVWTKITDA